MRVALQNDDEEDEEEDADDAEELLGKGARGAALLADRTRVSVCVRACVCERACLVCVCVTGVSAPGGGEGGGGGHGLCRGPHLLPEGGAGQAAGGAGCHQSQASRDQQPADGPARSEERRVGKECLRLCRSRWSPYH